MYHHLSGRIEAWPGTGMNRHGAALGTIYVLWQTGLLTNADFHQNMVESADEYIRETRLGLVRPMQEAVTIVVERPTLCDLRCVRKDRKRLYQNSYTVTGRLITGRNAKVTSTIKIEKIGMSISARR